MKSVFVVASLAAIAAAAPAAESSSCPATTTETYTYSGQAREYTTVTEYPASVGPTETVTKTKYSETGTVTSWLPVGPTVTTCATPEIVTINVEHTTTSYTGDYSSSSLRPSTSCAPTRAISDVYPDGTTTITSTVTSSAPQVTTFVTSETDALVFIHTTFSTTSTTTYSVCTSTLTSTTGTASSTVTQALKCAPTNLIGTDEVPGQHTSDAVHDGLASYGSGSSTTGDKPGEGANKDASSCCQACQDDENCAASLFAGFASASPPPFCQLWTKNNQTSESSCGLGFTIFPGDKQIASTGCGYIAENFYVPGECPESLSPRQCEEAGYVNKII